MGDETDCTCGRPKADHRGGCDIAARISELERERDDANALLTNARGDAAIAWRQHDERREERNTALAEASTLRSRLDAATDHVRKLVNVAGTWKRHSAHCTCNACDTVDKASASLTTPAPGSVETKSEPRELTPGEGSQNPPEETP